MTLSRLRAQAHKRFSWLLALVLLLPIAQTLTAFHVHSDAPTVEAEEAGVADLGGQNVCEVCLAAIALTGGIPPSRSFDHLQISVPATLPPVECVHAFCALAATGYESRAPPLARI